MKTLLNLFVLGACAALVTGCGTTSNLKPVVGADIRSIQKYSTVTVLDFADQTNGKSDATPQRLQELARHFADMVALELQNTKAFTKVSRVSTPQPGSLLVSGRLTRCTEGSANLRLWVGLGAGSTYLDATVEFADADSAQKLGQIVVDKNSWALGGGIAAGQTIESFMQGAAKTIAAQVAKAKADATAGK